MQILDKLNEDWLLSSEVHKLEARLWRKAQKERIQTVMITSAGRGEGKSTTVAYLAAVLGLHPDRRILAVDLDFRCPTLHTHFKIGPERSLGEVLRGDCAIEEAVRKTPLPSLDLVLPNPEGEDPGLLLKTPEFTEIFDFFRKSYDLILMDVPALVPVGDGATLLPLADGVILMAMAGKTTRPQFMRAHEICTGMDAKILGLIIGNLQEVLPEHRYGYGGYAYGYGNGKRKAGSNGDGGASG